ncbi:MAG TPA: prolyl oligopeptidase family serine peptidase [Rhizomicrobium sp.]|nr:prolyl oligopeptidase family serine peptidase [Rhizomicrobium sp.]
MAFASTLSGPRLPPARGAATHLVVFVHGYGANGEDLIALGQMWRKELPGCAFVAPNAPEPVPGAPGGYQWFGITRMDAAELARGVEGAADGLNKFVDAELARLSLPPEKLILVGFSQGTMMSLHLGLTRSVKPLAVLGYSGMLAVPPAAPLHDCSPIMLIHGDADPMIPASAMLAGVSELGRAGAAVQWHISAGTAHGIAEDGLALGGAFLSAAIAGRLVRKQPEISCPLG